jgi:dTDP-4-amino-4,6-dideoxygalactose transaminase
MTYALQELKVVSRILNSGVIMSIERNETELKGLERELKIFYQRNFCSLFNCTTGAIQAALMACGYGYGDSVLLNPEIAEKSIKKFINFLGISAESRVLGSDLLTPEISIFNIGKNNCSKQKDQVLSEIIIIDFAGFGYGTAAAVLLNDPKQYSVVDRLKIFGEQDLQTMRENKEANHNCEPSIQFNYRLSPLVAALIRAKLNAMWRL